MMAENTAGAISNEEIGWYHSPSQHPSAAGAYREGHPTEECWKTASWATRRLRGLSRVPGNCAPCHALRELPPEVAGVRDK
jgi:hypothetical protein